MECESVEEVTLFHEEQSDSAISAFKRDLHKVRTGRASSGIVEGIIVDYYGAKTPLKSLAQISTPEARLIHMQVFDAGAVQAIEKAILGSGIGLTPSTEGNVIRIVIPALTEETRKDLIKHVQKMAEDYRVSVRNHRRDANEAAKKLEKDGAITKDDLKRCLDEIQKQTDGAVGTIGEILTAKEAEISEV